MLEYVKENPYLIAAVACMPFQLWVMVGVFLLLHGLYKTF